MSNVFAVIMAGGAGTRFWPLSRKRQPKQFLPIGPGTNVPMITATAQRIAPLVSLDRTLVVTNASLLDATRASLPLLSPANILLEPVGRNTAPCVGWACARIARQDPKAIVCVLASDAFVRDDAAFVSALESAARAAAEGSIVTIGIRPTRAETGYGYLDVGEPGLIDGTHRVRAFVEKPDAQRAAEYLRSGHHLWNAGIFVFRVEVMLRALEEHLPLLAQALRAFDAAAESGNEQAVVQERYGTLPNVSLDVGVMEKLKDVMVVPVDCGWSDVGSWEAAWDLGDKDQDQNVLRADDGSVVALEAYRNLVFAPAGKTVALIGVDDLVVVDTPDALLVLPRSRAQEVKNMVDALRSRGRDEVL